MVMTPFLSYFKSLFKKMSLVLKLIYSIGKLDSNLEIHSWALQCLSVEFIVKIDIYGNFENVSVMWVERFM